MEAIQDRKQRMNSAAVFTIPAEAIPMKLPAKEEGAAMPPARTSDRITVPNSVIAIIATIMLALIGVVYTTINDKISEARVSADKRVDDLKGYYEREIIELKGRLSTQEIYTQNSREWLIKNGWDVTPQGVITRRGR